MLNPIRLELLLFLASVEVPVQNGSPRATDDSNAVEEVERVGGWAQAPMMGQCD